MDENPFPFWKPRGTLTSTRFNSWCQVLRPKSASTPKATEARCPQKRRQRPAHGETEASPSLRRCGHISEARFGEETHFCICNSV